MENNVISCNHKARTLPRIKNFLENSTIETEPKPETSRLLIRILPAQIYHFNLKFASL